MREAQDHLEFKIDTPSKEKLYERFQKEAEQLTKNQEKRKRKASEKKSKA